MGLVLELVKGLASDLGEVVDPEASNQICAKTYVDDGLGRRTREEVERYCGKLVDGHYDWMLAQIFSLVGLKLKVMTAFKTIDIKSIETTINTPDAIYSDPESSVVI